VGSSPSLRGRLAAVFVLLALFLTGCPDAGPSCSGDEQVSVKMAGTCASGERRLVITKSGCAIHISGDPQAIGSDGGAPASLGLPLRGATDMSNAPIRRGGWSVWGCLSGGEPCPDQFRICTAERVAFQLNITCIDGTGAPACQAVLTE
jgi:hypothetical protein